MQATARKEFTESRTLAFVYLSPWKEKTFRAEVPLQIRGARGEAGGKE
jgi:hypothetical protein